MAGSRQSKRVSWAPDVSLCQVRLFLSEDAPFQAGLAAQDHLQAKASWLLHASSSAPVGPTTSDDSLLPPGFESLTPVNHFKIDLSQIPLIKWKFPPEIILKGEWQVVAGEESEEIGKQNQRAYGLLEAIYPRQSSIPPNPSVTLEAQNSYYDDLQTPVVPITPIEDEDSPDLPEPSGTFLPEPKLLKTNSVDLAGFGTRPADVAAAASAAYTAIMRSNEQGSLIDRDLLVKILSDPSLIEKLLAEQANPNPNPNANFVPLATNTSAPFTAPPPPPPPPPPLPVPFNSMHGNPNPNPNPNVPSFNGPPPVLVINPRAMPGVTPMKDMSYYKSLIQKHGGEKFDGIGGQTSSMQFGSSYQNANLDTININNGQNNKSTNKIQKNCVYFNGPKGCRNGANCLYLHDDSVSVSTQNDRSNNKSAKRVKLDGSVSGRI